VPGWIYPAYEQLKFSKAIPNTVYGFSLGLNGAMLATWLPYLKGQMSAEEALSKADAQFQQQLKLQQG